MFTYTLHCKIGVHLFYYKFLGERFIETLKDAKIKRRLRKITARKIQYNISWSWWLALMKNKVGVPEEYPLPNYQFSEIVSQYTRETATGDVKGKIGKDVYKVALQVERL